MSYVGHSIGDVMFIRTSLAGTEVPDTTKQTGTPWISMKDKRTIAFILHVNGAAIGGTTPLITFAIEQATALAGTGAKAVTGASIAKTNPLGLENDGDIMCVEVDVGSLDTENDFFFVTPVWTFSDVTGSNLINVAAVAVPNRMGRDVNGVEVGVGISTNYVKAK